MTDYKPIKTNKGHAVLCPGGHLSNGQDKLTKEEAENLADLLNSFRLDKPRKQ